MLTPLRMAAQVPELLAQAASGRVHSCFERVCNLAFGDWLVALVLPGVPLVPGGITVARSGGWPLAPGAAVSFDGQRLALGPVQLDLTGLPVWQSGPGLGEVAGPSPLKARARTLDELITSQGQGSLAHHKGWAEYAWPLIEALRAALWRKDDLVAAATPLVGLGEGLTPSGDDLLMGLLAGLHYGGKAPGPLGPWLFAHAPRATTAVSATYLRFACQGAFSEELEGVATTLLGVAEADWAKVRGLLAYGHSSGTDTLIGLSMAMDFLAAGGES